MAGKHEGLLSISPPGPALLLLLATIDPCNVPKRSQGAVAQVHQLRVGHLGWESGSQLSEYEAAPAVQDGPLGAGVSVLQCLIYAWALRGSLLQ